MLNLRKFFVYSFGVHLLFFAAVILLIPRGERPPDRGEFFTHLVTPDELLPVKPFFSEKESYPRAPRSSRQLISPSPRVDRIPDGSRKQKESPLIDSSHGSIPEREAETRPAIGGSAEKQARQDTSVKNKLFDRSVIGDIARRNVEKEESGKRVFTFDISEYKYLIYNQRLKQRIESIWVYPRDAAAKGIYGDLVVRFTILQNGDLGSVELIRTSGYKKLDDAAMKALHDGAPYWPLPKEWGLEAYTIEGLFIYTLYGYYIM